MSKLVNAAGTVLTKADLPKTTDHTDIFYKITEPVYLVSPFDGDSGEQKLSLFWHEGQVIPAAEFDAAFVAATFVSITPDTGAAAGGTDVTIKGTNLEGSSGVTFGGTAATAVVVVDEETITCTTPAHTSGAVNVVIADDAGNVTATGAFTYT